ncbi:RING-H2 finger protein ATL70-like [Salvia splendens]|uniref:RING-H2 finger protein ATL70-like n=1 Tax=Salvia splendens TaxID=180675 RepID=UPI001C25EB39|nr:RING-H2 finger protein ATL70-like [Salvia splendens]
MSNDCGLGGFGYFMALFIGVLVIFAVITDLTSPSARDHLSPIPPPPPSAAAPPSPIMPLPHLSTSSTSSTPRPSPPSRPIVGTALGGFGYGVGLSIAVITYFSYKCKKSRPNSSPFSSSVRSRYFPGGGADSVHVVIHRNGLDAAAISAIPLYTYARLGPSGCAVCLGEYKESEEVRLMPECGHVFHRSSIDPWLMIHPRCPICRKTTCRRWRRW